MSRPDLEIFALLANVVYDDDFGERRLQQKDWELFGNGYYDQACKLGFALYKEKDGNRYIFSVRGTNEWKDFRDNLRILAEQDPPKLLVLIDRVREMVNLDDSTKEYYITGHSLGALLAERVVVQMDSIIEAVTFESPGSPFTEKSPNNSKVHSCIVNRFYVEAHQMEKSADSLIGSSNPGGNVYGIRTLLSKEVFDSVSALKSEWLGNALGTVGEWFAGGDGVEVASFLSASISAAATVYQKLFKVHSMDGILDAISKRLHNLQVIKKVSDLNLLTNDGPGFQNTSQANLNSNANFVQGGNMNNSDNGTVVVASGNNAGSLSSSQVITSGGDSAFLSESLPTVAADLKYKKTAEKYLGYFLDKNNKVSGKEGLVGGEIFVHEPTFVYKVKTYAYEKREIKKIEHKFGVSINFSNSIASSRIGGAASSLSERIKKKCILLLECSYQSKCEIRDARYDLKDRSMVRYVGSGFVSSGFLFYKEIELSEFVDESHDSLDAALSIFNRSIEASYGYRNESSSSIREQNSIAQFIGFGGFNLDNIQSMGVQDSRLKTIEDQIRNKRNQISGCFVMPIQSEDIVYCCRDKNRQVLIEEVGKVNQLLSRNLSVFSIEYQQMLDGLLSKLTSDQWKEDDYLENVKEYRIIVELVSALEIPVFEKNHHIELDDRRVICVSDSEHGVLGVVGSRDRRALFKVLPVEGNPSEFYLAFASGSDSNQAYCSVKFSSGVRKLRLSKNVKDRVSFQLVSTMNLDGKHSYFLSSIHGFLSFDEKNQEFLYVLSGKKLKLMIIPQEKITVGSDHFKDSGGAISKEDVEDYRKKYFGISNNDSITLIPSLSQEIESWMDSDLANIVHAKGKTLNIVLGPEGSGKSFLINRIVGHKAEETHPGSCEFFIDGSKNPLLPYSESKKSGTSVTSGPRIFGNFVDTPGYGQSGNSTMHAFTMKLFANAIHGVNRIFFVFNGKLLGERSYLNNLIKALKGMIAGGYDQISGEFISIINFQGEKQSRERESLGKN